MKNLMGKSRGKSEPYAIFKGIGVFGTTEVSLLKVYEKPALEVSNDYALWSVAIKTEETYETYDEGDVYVGEVVDGLTLVEASDNFMEHYGDCLEYLQTKAGFKISNKCVMPKT